jgi:hypothetical protein
MPHWFRVDDALKVKKPGLHLYANMRQRMRAHACGQYKSYKADDLDELLIFSLCRFIDACPEVQ